MRADVLANAMGGAVTNARYAQLVGPFTAAMAAAGCTTVARAAMWCAQLGHESLGLRYMEEIASGEAYEGRRDLGNTQPGDGKRYKGRGPIQVTGRANYTALSKWAHTRGLAPTSTFFVDQPEQLASDLHGFTGAVWYWTAARPQLNAMSDAGDIAATTRAINGGTNGLDARRARWDRCRAIGAALLDGAPAPTTSTPGGDWFDMATRDDLISAIREVCGAPAQRGDVGFAADQIMTAMGIDRTTAPSKLSAEQRAPLAMALRTDVGYVLQQLGGRLDEIEHAVTSQGATGGQALDYGRLADAVLDAVVRRAATG